MGRFDHITSRLDSDPNNPGFGAFIERALNHIVAETYNTEIPPLKGRQLVPTQGKAPAGAKSISYVQRTRAGIAQWIANYGDDLPAASLWTKEFVAKIYAIGASYGYTLPDLMAAQMASSQGGPPLNIDLELALAAREAIEKKLDSAARVGTADGNSPDLGLTGAINNPNVPRYTVATGASGYTDFARKTPDEIAADLHGIANYIVTSTYEIESGPKTLALPLAQFGLVTTKRMGDGSNVTIAEYVKATSPYIKEIVGWQYLAGAADDSSDRMWCYEKNPRKLWHEIPMEFRQEAPQLENLEIKVPCWAKSAGVIIPYPLSMAYGDGI